jgi:hypothetical protein
MLKKKEQGKKEKPSEEYRRFEDFASRIMAVPAKEIERERAKAEAKKQKKK